VVLRFQISPCVHSRIQSENVAVAVVDNSASFGVPAGHVEGMYRAGSLDSVEVPPANAVCVIVAANDLRRSAITNWAKKLPIQVFQILAGHSDIATTRKYYLAVRSEDLALANELVDEILARTPRD